MFWFAGSGGGGGGGLGGGGAVSGVAAAVALDEDTRSAGSGDCVHPTANAVMIQATGRCRRGFMLSLYRAFYRSGSVLMTLS